MDVTHARSPAFEIWRQIMASGARGPSQDDFGVRISPKRANGVGSNGVGTKFSI